MPLTAVERTLLEKSANDNGPLPAGDWLAFLPSRGRDVDGGYVIQIGEHRWVAHTEFHRRHQDLDELALDVGEAQLRLYRREHLQVLSHVWNLCGSATDLLLEDCELVVGAPLADLSGSRCQYRRVNLRGLGWEELLCSAPSSLWPLTPLTRDGASTAAVLRTRDVIEDQIQMSVGDRADRLAILWFMAEAEGVASAMLKEFITEEKLMESELYRSILHKGIEKGRIEGYREGLDKGIDKGIDRGTRERIKQTITRILMRRLGYLDDAVRVRLEAETSLLLLEPWYDEALDASDEAAARSLAERIGQAPLPRRDPP